MSYCHNLRARNVFPALLITFGLFLISSAGVLGALPDSKAASADRSKKYDGISRFTYACSEYVSSVNMQTARLPIWKKSPFRVGHPIADASIMDGELDTEFGSGGHVRHDFSADHAGGHDIAIDSEGRLIVGGSVSVDGNQRMLLARFRSDGTLDDTFGSEGSVIDDAVTSGIAFAVQSDSKIIVEGHATIDGNDDIVLARYQSDGRLDTSFGEDGRTYLDFEGGNDFERRLIVLTDGEILVLGGTMDQNKSEIALARLHEDGSIDRTFGTDGKMTANFGERSHPGDLVPQPDGKFVVTAQYIEGGVSFTALARYLEDGEPDSSFATEGIVAMESLRDPSAALQNDGKIVLAGGIGLFSDGDISLARFTADGTPDATFGMDGTVTTDISGDWDSANDVVIQDDGKVLVAGFTGSSSCPQDPDGRNVALVRYESDGTLDESFGIEGVVQSNFGGSDMASTIVIDGDGRVVVTGTVQTTGGSCTTEFDLLLARYHAGATSSTGVTQPDGRHRTAILHQNAPNPVVSTTAIEFELREPQPTSLIVYDALGREAATLILQQLPAGRHMVEWQPEGLPAGLYVYRLRTGGFEATRRMVLLPSAR